MPLFGRRQQDMPSHPAAAPTVPGLAAAVAAQGWQPAPARPFGGRLADPVHDITRTMYGAARGTVYGNQITVGTTIFRDAFSGSIDGRTYLVANAWTYIEPKLFGNEPHLGDVAVCAAELPSMLPMLLAQPRRFHPARRGRGTPTGNPGFDDRYLVMPLPAAGPDVLTPEIQQRIMGHDDWVFWAEDYLLICVSKGAFRTVEDVTRRVGEVMGIIGAIPASVMPARVDHSQDGLMAQISRLDTVEDALAFLQRLTHEQREQLARSDTPLAAFAWVQTPDEAMARLQQLDNAAKMQLIAMFMRAEDR
jgi:hypothetical protein